MRKMILILVLCLCLVGCGQEVAEAPKTHSVPSETAVPTETTAPPVDYAFRYQDTYLTMEDSEVFYGWYCEKAQNGEQLPVLILQSREDADTLMAALGEKHSQEAAAQLETLLEQTRQLLWVEELFEQWSVAMILCREENGAVQHIVQGSVSEDIYTLTVLRIGNEEGGQPKLRMLPIWIPKVRLAGYQAVEAVWGKTLAQRYPLSVSLSENTCRSVITEDTWASSLDYEICYQNVTRVEIDFAGEKVELRTALESGRITMEELLLRAQIDADSGLCRWDQYNDGGTIVFMYEGYRLYKLETRSGSGNVWITGPDVRLNEFK